MSNNTEIKIKIDCDVVVVGGGHAGCEAALASSRMGFKTILFAINMDSIGMMPCNPNIGGTSKGHLVRELDALGGEMGRNIDKTYLQSKMLNLTKGPAVHSLRAQADKQRYSQEMKKTLENTPNLQLRQGQVVELLAENGTIKAVKLISGTIYNAKAVILATGTYLKARCLHGDVIENCGPSGFMASNALSDSLRNLGINLLRFKTGTPARIDKRTLDFSQMTIQEGDEKVVPFSFENKREDIEREQLPCYLTYTTPKTHEIIKNNIERSPMYSGEIKGAPTRYCPSIEDKVVRFADKERHQIFVEPEGETTNEMYIQGMSTSLPEDVQLEMYRSLPGFSNCHIIKNGYAIEYDCLDSTQLNTNLSFKKYNNLFSAGQLNGSSGYEEAAAQGIIAGINAGLHLKGEEPLILDRATAYIGVLIDDLVVKGTKEPYRMMTSRAEYRLLLRQDNADLRLTEMGYKIGLISEERYEKFKEKKMLIEEEIKRAEKQVLKPNNELQEILDENNSTRVTTGMTLGEMIRRPELDYFKLEKVDKNRPVLDEETAEQVNIQIKYNGYIKRQQEQVDAFKKMEERKLENINYNELDGLRLEAKQKLTQIMPVNLGQASRITGVSPADISVLIVALEAMKRKKS